MTLHHLTRRSLLPLFAAAALMTVGCQPLGELTYDTSQPEMVAFNSCGDLENFLKVQALSKAAFQQSAFNLGETYSASGFVNEPTLDSGTTPEPDSPDVTYSETNLQEEGVDEADIFKVDATHAFALHGNDLVIIEALGEVIHTPDQGGILQIDGGLVVAQQTVPGNPFEMFLNQNKVIVMTLTTHQAVNDDVKLLIDGTAPTRPSGSGLVKVLVYDVTDRSAPVLEREVAVEGQYVSSRRIDDQVYVVARAMLGGPALDSPIGGEAAWLLQRELAIRSSGMDAWMPSYYDIDHLAGETASATVNSVDCSTTYASRATNGDQALGIYSFDFTDTKSKVETTTIMGDGAIVYGSKDSIIVALTNFAQMTYSEEDNENVDLLNDDDWLGLDDDPWLGDGFIGTNSASDSGAPETEKTYLHRFELADGGGVRYHATGVVDGWILNQFSISEFDGHVRVATQRNRGDFEAESMVFVLKPSSKSGILQAPQGTQAEFLQVVGSLYDVGLGEDLYATRFKGDVGYLVTYRETDPLWTIDISNPNNPVLRGELMVPGYSTYLHPIDGKKLLAIGRSGLSDGIKLSLFDVSDLDRPDDIDELDEGSSSSECEALTEHRAFRYLPEERLLMVPMTHSSSQGMFVYSVDPSSGFDLKKRIEHASMAESDAAARVRRAYRIGDYLYTYSGGGVAISELSSLETVAEVNLVDAL